ncbi:MAG: hypothetical protein GY757_28795, partial [bacterium]|nr:hypothetical protein [bacterium]
FYIEKKDNTRNKSDLYPQAAVLLYQWIVDKHLKEQVLKEGDCNGDGLSMHRFRTNVVFYYKRLMEYYFAYRLLLTVIGNRILGLGKNPPNFTTRHAEIEDLDVNKTFNLLLEKEEWKPSRPLLLRYSRLIRTPDGNLLTHLLNRGELAAFASASESPLQDGFLENETQAFKDLVVAWLQFLMNSHNNPDAQPTKDKKLPITYRALSKLKENLAGIKDLAEGISSTENLLDRRQCLLISQLCFNYIEYIDSWLREFNHWFVRLGEGTKEYHGICRYLNIQLNDWDIAIQASGQFLTTPSFTFTPAIKKHIYHTYFHDLENHIVDRLHWSIRQEGKLALKIAGPELVEFISESGQQMTDEILKQLLDLPGYYAATLNRWHKMTIRDYIRLVKDTGIDIVKQTLVPPLADTTRHDLLFTGQASYDTLEPHVPNGIASDTLQAQNPYIYGFHKCRINHPQKENREINFDALPPFIFAEEWNCYHALTVYRQVTGIEAAVPTYPVVALCRDMKKLLAAVNLGIMEQRIRTQQQSQMIYTFANLVNVPQTTHKENDIFKLIARVIQSDDPAVLQELDMAYRRILLLKAADIKEPLMDSPLPISTQTKKQLYQVVAGGTEFFRNLEMQTSLS